MNETKFARKEPVEITFENLECDSEFDADVRFKKMLASLNCFGSSLPEDD